MAKRKSEGTRFERFRAQLENKWWWVALLVLSLVVATVKPLYEAAHGIATHISSDVDVTIALDEELSQAKDEGGSHPDFLTSYTSNATADRVVVTPNGPYLKKLLEESRVSWFVALPCDPTIQYFEVMHPTFDLRLINRTSATIVLASIHAEVERSTADLEPLPIVCVAWDDLNAFTVINAGWGPIDAPRLVGRLRSHDPDATYIGKEHVREWPSIVDAIRVDVTPNLRLDGVDVEQLARYQSAEGMTDQQFATLRAATGPYASGIGVQEEGDVTFSGTLTYRSTMSEQVFADRHVQFEVPVPLLPPDGLGDYLPYARKYDLLLRADGANYVSNAKQIAHTLKRDEAERIAVTVMAPQSSKHRFRIVATTSDQKQLKSGWVEADLFVPRGKAEE